MTFRTLSIAAIAVFCTLGLAHAAPTATPLSDKAATHVTSVEASLSAYRQYVKTQADSLVGMTRVLAREIKNGDLDAAQMAYAPAHGYLKRIEPIVRPLRDLDSGFHRIEYGLYARKSTKDLSDDADRLDEDARAMRERLAFLDVTRAALVDGVIGNLQEVADKTLAGDEERYSRTDLWDLEANIEGARQVVSMLQPRLQAQRPEVLSSTAIHFAEIDALLEKHKVGCGFKNFDELSQADRMALKAPVEALAAELSTLRGTLAMD